MLRILTALFMTFSCCFQVIAQQPVPPTNPPGSSAQPEVKMSAESCKSICDSSKEGALSADKKNLFNQCASLGFCFWDSHKYPPVAGGGPEMPSLPRIF
jgi:hypothetical protein